MRKNHCSIRKNTIRNNHFIYEPIPRTPLEITNLSKNLLLGLKFIIWLCVLFSSDKLLASINCCKTYQQPNSFTHSLINLLYWAYWAHILFYLGLSYDLWPYNNYHCNFSFQVYENYCVNLIFRMPPTNPIIANINYIHTCSLQRVEIQFIVAACNFKK